MAMTGFTGGSTSGDGGTNWLNALMQSIMRFMPQVQQQALNYSGQAAKQAAAIQNDAANYTTYPKSQRQLEWEYEQKNPITKTGGMNDVYNWAMENYRKNLPNVFSQYDPSLSMGQLAGRDLALQMVGFKPGTGGGGGSSAPYQQMYDTAQSNKSIYENYDTELGKSVPKSTAQPAAQPAAPAASSYSPVALPPTSTAGQGYDYEAPVSSDEGYGLGMGSISPVAKSSAGAKTLATEDSDMFKSLKQYLNNYMKNQKWL